MSDSAAFPLKLPPLVVERAVRPALKEDLGQAGDITTDSIVPADAQGEAAIVARQDGVVAGLDLAEAAFKALDLDVIVYNYESSPGARSPRRVEDIDRTVMVAAILKGFNERYGSGATELSQVTE